MTIATADVSELIPHQPPMRLLDTVVDFSATGLAATARLSEQHPFWSPRGIPASMGLEYLGQAAAAFFTLLGSAESSATSASSVAPSDQQRPRPGMLIASRRYECYSGYFPASGTLKIQIAPTSQIGASGLVKFTGTLSDAASLERFAQGDLSVYLPPA